MSCHLCDLTNSVKPLFHSFEFVHVALILAQSSCRLSHDDVKSQVFLHSHKEAPMSDQQRQALVSMPTSAQLGGDKIQPFVRFPFYPTSPWYSTDVNVGYQVRMYSTGLTSNDADFLLGSESIRTVQFDLPCRLIAINGAMSNPTAAGAIGTLTEQNMNLHYLFRSEYTTGDRLQVSARLASTVVGTAQNPGEIGGHGYNIDQGATLTIGLTPLLAPGAAVIRIDITLVCLEMRGPRNFSF